MPALNSRSLARLRSSKTAGSDRGGSGDSIPPIVRDLEVPARITRVWDALTEPSTIAQWLTCQDIAFEPRVGGGYSLFDGDATGTVTRIEPPHLVEYTWTMEGWPEGAPPSLVRWELSPVAGGKRTRLRLTHAQFPDRATRDDHESGWDPYFLDKLLPWLAARPTT
jgi:uncharacterized protein YndB with AHSA1/START domain